MNAVVAVTPPSTESKRPMAKTRTISARVTEAEYSALRAIPGRMAKPWATGRETV
jgi:hypothetical protein